MYPDRPDVRTMMPDKIIDIHKQLMEQKRWVAAAQAYTAQIEQEKKEAHDDEKI